MKIKKFGVKWSVDDISVRDKDILDKIVSDLEEFTKDFLEEINSQLMNDP